jgi:hypothetical protein
MHGGCSRGPKTLAGREHARHAALRHGGYTKEAKAKHKEVMELIKTSKNMLNGL